ncbi:MAG: sugar phosphorylase [Anaerolineae bacterium]|nr:sugar phosphorylase [Anaerolineae bacterium]
MLNDDLRSRIAHKLIDLYGAESGAALNTRLIALLEQSKVAPQQQLWSQTDAVVICYADHLHRDDGTQTPLAALHDFLARHCQDAVSTVHLLPFYPYTSDDGFSVSDYRAVNAEAGTWADVAALQATFKLMFDLVINHTSVSHDWFQAFLRDEAPYNDYYIALDPATDVSQVTRPRTHPLLTPFETRAGIRYVWTTFSEDQVDLNFSHPDVLLEMIEVLLFYIERGAQIIRLDAIAYLWKEIGTTCIHLPQTHEVVRLFRDVLESVAPNVLLLTETNVPHDENMSYFGDGTDEAQMIYNFALPPLLVHTLQTGDANALTSWADSLELPSEQTTFFNFTASHDGIGVRPATGLLTPEQITRMIERVKAHGGRISEKRNADGSTSPYEMNIVYFDALSAPDDPLAVDRFICSQAIMLALQGIPGIYLHSLLGSRNWQEGVEETGRARSINRQKLDVETLEAELKEAGSIRARVFSRYLDLLKQRRSNPAFHPNANQRVLYVGTSIFALERTALDGSQRALCLHNVRAQDVTVVLPSGPRTLKAYEVAWLFTSDTAPVPAPSV